MTALIFTFILTLIIGMPIAFVIGMTGMAHILSLDNMQYFDVFIQRLVSGVNSNSYLCIPMFVLAGQLMNRGGITERLLGFIRECIGFIRGGMAYAAVMVGMLLSAILGSSNAVASIMCSVVVPELEKDGYDKDFSIAVSASSGILGPIIPPGTSMVIMAVMTGVSVRSMFYAGVIPGILIGVAFMIVAGIMTKVRKYPKSKEHFEAKSWIQSLFRAGPSLLVPFIIIFGVSFGVFTAAEAGCIAVAIALACGFGYHNLSLRELPEIMLQSIHTSAGILFIVAFGNVLGWTMAIDQIPVKISEAILSVTSSPILVLFMIMEIMFMLGFVLEGYSAMMIFGPVFAVVAAAVGIDLIHYCMLFIIIINIGLLTPPVGMILFVASNICDIPLSKISRSIWPFVTVAMIAVLILICFPQLMLFLPSHMG